MSRTGELFKRGKMLCIAIVTLFIIVHADESIKYLHFYDAADNSIMFYEFKYDGDVNTERTLYMADSTFVKRTIIETTTAGKIETSYNFNGDTLFCSKISTDGNQKVLNVKDQFGVDQLDGDVRIKGDANDYDISQGGNLINKINYADNDRINIYNSTGELLYYAKMETNVGVIHRYKNNTIATTLNALRNNRFVFNFNLTEPSTVCCELISLSGRQVGKLFNKVYAAGAGKEMINMSKSMPHLVNGIYFVNLTVDGKKVMKEKILVQRSNGGF
jgi:hypothetical protein